jgi:hypothetical protein
VLLLLRQCGSDPQVLLLLLLLLLTLLASI